MPATVLSLTSRPYGQLVLLAVAVVDLAVAALLLRRGQSANRVVAAALALCAAVLAWAALYEPSASPVAPALV